ncbi:MAG: YceI family protein [Woeseiaceae bacterium]|nr:YceI family protein [Woeseiaceae bacterium]
MRNKFHLLTVLSVLAMAPVQAQDSSASRQYRVDSDASLLRVLAWPDGPLKRFGHHHVISHHGITGTVDVAANPHESSFVLELTVANLVVDDPELRALESTEFEGEVPQGDMDGTKANMLGEDLLNIAQFPKIKIQSSSIEGELPNVNIVATYTVLGAEQTVAVPAQVELTEDRVVARGEIELLHGAFGLSPFTAMGGALSVRDLLMFKYEIVGTRVVAAE